MFKNIGMKIKGLAKFIFWVLTILSVIGGLIIIIQAFGSSAANSQDKIVGILIGVGVIIVGIIVAWLQNFLLYGFGELVDSNQRILRCLEERQIDQIVASQTKFPQNPQQ